VIARIDENGKASASTPAQTSASAPAAPRAVSEAAPVPTENGHADGGEVRAGPAARQEAQKTGIALSDVQGTGPRGRVTTDDVRKTRAPEPRQPPARQGDDARVERVPMTPLRRTIARRLVAAQHNAAMLTTFNEIDMSEVMALRKRHQERFVEKHGVKLGFMSFFVKAAIEALKEFPAVNGEIDGDDIVYKHYYDIGVAVSGPKGLVVPVIRDADQLSFSEVELAIGELSTRARENKLRIEDFEGGTFTISNGGVFGSLMSTPILNPPQSGILGMHAIQERPVGIDGKIELRPMMYVALSYDHRIIDGREAVSFLVRLKQCVERPERILLEV
jgi:2-oxoglutarate dehydrogenase E2 component (dihydrolipoamide succinyltransferase)